MIDAEDLPLAHAPVAEPDDEVSWVWSDGHLHPHPPRPAARVFFIEAGLDLPTPFYPVVEAPPCGAVWDVPGSAMVDGQRRRYTCDHIAGHPTVPSPPSSFWPHSVSMDDDPAVHRMVSGTEPDQSFGITTQWKVGHEWSTEPAS